MPAKMVGHSWKRTFEDGTAVRTCRRCGVSQWRRPRRTPAEKPLQWQGPFDRRGLVRLGSVECDQEVVESVLGS